MAVRLSSWWMRPSLIGTLFAELRLAWRLLREPRVAFYAKAVPALAALYVISPLDVIPDILPVLGQVDDLGIIILSVKLFLRFCPASIKDFHARAIASGRAFEPMTPADLVIDATYRKE